MATYEEIYGKRVEVLDADPTLSSAYEGQVWYNSTTGTLKSVVQVAAWSSASTSINGGSSRIGFGIQTAGIAAGGSLAPGNQTVVEEYNGSGWSVETALPTDRQDGGGAGTTTAGLVWCGEGPSKLNTTLEYDGSSWTTTNTYPISARGVRGSGTQTAAIGDGGDTPAPAASNVSAEYNGSTWTAGNNLPGNRIAAATSGPQTSALATTGKDNTPNPSVSNLNTSYDGTSWTAETVYPLSLRQAVSTGTSSAANLVAGGVAAVPFGDATTKANVWDGSSWTAVADLGTKSTHGNGAGSSTASYINSGAQDYPSYPGVTQEFNQSINTITAAAWASGGAMGTARYAISGVGTQTAALGAMGYTPSGKPASWKYTEEYNGTSWAEQTDMATARFSGGAFGVQTSAIFAGGNLDPGYSDAVEEYNGSSWTNVTSLPAVRKAAPGFGVETAGVVCGGNLPAATDTSLEYNGSSWTAGGTMPSTGGGENSGSGILTAGLFVVGATTPPNVGATYEYNGSAWTAGGTTIDSSDSRSVSSAGTQASSIIFGGDPQKKSAEGYDGTAWSTRPSLATGRSRAGGAGTATAGLAFGGKTTAVSTATEEFTGDVETVTAKTLTTS